MLGKEIWDVLDEKIQEEPGAFLSAVNSYATRKKNIRIYLLIDEYDNFTNTILSTYGTEFYRKAPGSYCIFSSRTSQISFPNKSSYLKTKSLSLLQQCSLNDSSTSLTLELTSEKLNRMMRN